MPLHALNKLPYGKLSGHKIGVKEGVMFLTYSSLISSSGVLLLCLSTAFENGSSCPPNLA